jgi:hypothetical protein
MPARMYVTAADAIVALWALGQGGYQSSTLLESALAVFGDDWGLGPPLVGPEDAVLLLEALAAAQTGRQPACSELVTQVGWCFCVCVCVCVWVGVGVGVCVDMCVGGGARGLVACTGQRVALLRREGGAPSNSSGCRRQLQVRMHVHACARTNTHEHRHARRVTPPRARR